MSDCRWKEIPNPVGVAMWIPLRPLIGKSVWVGETISDPDGQYGSPMMMTAFYARGGEQPSAWLLKLVTTWERDRRGETEVTRYYVPNGDIDTGE